MRHQHQTRTMHVARLLWLADMLDVMQKTSKQLRNSNLNVMISSMLGQRSIKYSVIHVPFWISACVYVNTISRSRPQPSSLSSRGGHRQCSIVNVPCPFVIIMFRLLIRGSMWPSSSAHRGSLIRHPRWRMHHQTGCTAVASLATTNRAHQRWTILG